MGIAPSICVRASYERTVFDLLCFHIEHKSQTVPNMQPSDLKCSGLQVHSKLSSECERTKRCPATALLGSPILFLVIPKLGLPN